MTVPRGLPTIGKISEWVRELLPAGRRRATQHESDLAIHLSTNEALYLALRGIIEARLTGRASVVEPTNPIDCKTLLARDGECRWFLNVIERARQSKPHDSEPPEA